MPKSLSRIVAAAVLAVVVLLIAAEFVPSLLGG
jgi:hypothetical protein